MQISPTAAKLPNPFNSSSPVDPLDFVGRTQELENFKQKLRQTASGSLASMAVAGGYGVGKTSFLHKCNRIAQEQGALTVYFSLSELDKLDRETLARLLIERVRDKVQEEVILERLSRKVLDVLTRIRVKMGTSIEIGLKEQENYPTLQAALVASWKAISGSRTSIVFLIDEASVLERNRADLIQYLRAVLEQLQVERIPIMLVPAGKFSITGPSGTGFSPLVRTFPPVILENFTSQESSVFIEKKLSATGLKISAEAVEKVYSFTEGHPFVLAAYMATAYSKLSGEEKEMSIVPFQAADVEFVHHVLAPFFSRFYDDASPLSKKILEVFAQSSIAGGEVLLSELTDALKRNSNELSPYLAKLVQDGSVIRKDRGKYKLFHHLFGEYILNKSTIAP